MREGEGDGNLALLLSLAEVSFFWSDMLAEVRSGQVISMAASKRQWQWGQRPPEVEM